ncbi:MAG: PIN domain-containing protein, partial [Phycisphaeraceae bacterium]
LQTKDDFRFVIPYVEFAKEIRGSRPTIVDTSVIVDGRILDIIATGVMQGTLIVPKFVLNELQTIADSGEKLRRARGRRGLEILGKLQETHIVDVSIHEAEHVEGVGVDQKLIALAQQLQGRVMTNDYNLNKIARLRGVDVINLNDLAKALRPVVLPGEHMTVRLVKPGENPAQGVGYLEDGTMVVVEDGRDHLGREVRLVVTSTLQTSAGRMIFGRYESLLEEAPAPAAPATTAAAATPPADHADAGHGPPAHAATADAGEAGVAGEAGGGDPVAQTHGGRATRVGRNPRRSR